MKNAQDMKKFISSPFLPDDVIMSLAQKIPYNIKLFK